jgi:prepilin-type N-terminal cleavage/methylation domain-containing protein
MENAIPRSGFTLIELSIVLVIIGLIVGGVLVGQDLVKAASLRSQIGQIEKYRTAVNTFLTKYNGMPGDLAQAANFGFAARTGNAGQGDNNRLLESCASGVSNTTAGCETTLFWRDLSSASFIDSSFSTATNAVATMTSAQAPNYFPSSKLDSASSVVVVYDEVNNHQNYFYIARINSTSGAGAYSIGYGLTPNDTYNMDLKTDDGIPGSGTVVAASGAISLSPGSIVGCGGACCGDLAGNYNLVPAFANLQSCQVAFRMLN